ncbi:ABC transporter ATP-binding protein [Natrialbaceae archaeon A-CW3]
MTTIALHGVEKRYGDVAALRGIDLEVGAGEVFGFLGPNGAGKSTTIDILLRYTHPTSGSVTVLDHDVTSEPVPVRKRTGILPEGYAPFETMTGRQHVEYAIEANDADDDPDALLERVDVAHATDRQASGYSKGMTQRLGLAMALVGEPDLLVLDEPSTGLDPHGVRLMRRIVREERDRGATVFFSSHILEQVEAVADRVGILRHGQLIAVDTIDGLRAAAETDAELVVDVTVDGGAAGRVAGDPGSETSMGMGTGTGTDTERDGSASLESETSLESDPKPDLEARSDLEVAPDPDLEARSDLEVAPDPDLEGIITAVDSIDGVSSVRRRDDALVVGCTTETKLAVLDTIRDAGGAITDFTTAEASLEELFVSYTEAEPYAETEGQR